MIIFFHRHASAGQRVSNPKKDEKRPLDEQGIDQCRYVGRALAAAEVQVDAIISSPLKRATQTAALTGNELGYEGKLFIEAALRPDGDWDAFCSMLRRYSKLDSIMLVGHNPTLSEYCSALVTGGRETEVIDLKKGAIAQVEYSGKTSAILNWCLTPKLARMLQATEATRSRPKTARK